MLPLIIDRDLIKTKALENEDENDAFRSYVQKINTETLDVQVHALNKVITPQIDCTTCGACCKQLMINVTPQENETVANFLEITPTDFKENYLEESVQGKLIINTIPCHFLADTKCTIYENRFTECKAFPHLHEPNFKNRLFGTLIHYAMCPIIYNVVEQLKLTVGFKQ